MAVSYTHLAAPALASLPPPFDSSRMMGVVKKLADKMCIRDRDRGDETIRRG